MWQREFKQGADGLFSAVKRPSTTTPGPIDMNIMDLPGKPAPGHINPDKIKVEADRRYQKSLDDQRAQQAQQAAQAAEGGKIICLRWAELNLMTPELSFLDQAYGAYLMKTNPAWQKGYLRYAKTLVKRLHNTTWQSRLLIKVMSPFVFVWSRQMGHIMGGPYSYNLFGAFLMWLMVKVFEMMNSCRLVKIRLKKALRKFTELSVFYRM